MHIINIVDVPLFHSLFVYGYTHKVVKQKQENIHSFDSKAKNLVQYISSHYEHEESQIKDETEKVYELIRYQYNQQNQTDDKTQNYFEQINDFKYPLPPQDYNYSTMIALKSQNLKRKEYYIYIFGGLQIRNPLIYRLKIFEIFIQQQKTYKIISDSFWESVEVRCPFRESEIEYQFQFRRFLGVHHLPYNSNFQDNQLLQKQQKDDCINLIIFGGSRKMQNIETWCICKLDHQKCTLEIQQHYNDCIDEKAKGKKIQNQKSNEMMLQRGPIEQNQTWISQSFSNHSNKIYGYLYSIKFGYLHIFDLQDLKWSGIDVQFEDSD